MKGSNIWAASTIQLLICNLFWPTCTQKAKSPHAHTPDSAHPLPSLPFIASITANWSKGWKRHFALLFFFLKKGEHWKIHVGGKRFWDDQQRSLKGSLWQMCVRAKCVLWVLGRDGVPQGALLSLLTLRCYNAHPSTLGAISHHLLLPAFPACQTKQIQPGIDFWLRIAFFCSPRHPLISLIPIWHQIIDPAGLLANSGAFHSTLGLCGCVSPALRLFSAELSACRAPVSRGLHHGTLHPSHMHPHTV